MGALRTLRNICFEHAEDGFMDGFIKAKVSGVRSVGFCLSGQVSEFIILWLIEIALLTAPASPTPEQFTQLTEAKSLKEQIIKLIDLPLPLPEQAIAKVTPDISSFAEDFKLIVDIFLVLTNATAAQIEKLHRLEVLQALQLLLPAFGKDHKDQIMAIMTIYGAAEEPPKPEEKEEKEEVQAIEAIEADPEEERKMAEMD